MSWSWLRVSMSLCPPNHLSWGPRLPDNLPLGKVMPLHTDTHGGSVLRLHSCSKTTDPRPVLHSLRHPTSHKDSWQKKHSMGALLTCTDTQETATGQDPLQETATQDSHRTTTTQEADTQPQPLRSMATQELATQPQPHGSEHKPQPCGYTGDHTAT